MKYLREPFTVSAMTEPLSVEEIEKEIDETFAASPLLDVGYAQAMWTVLSVNEDHYLKHLRVLGDQEMEIYTDTHLNALTHPLRAISKRANRTATPLNNQLIDRDYASAWKWIDASVQYDQFCTLFPLLRRGRIQVQPSAGRRLQVSNKHNSDHRYEAYNRFVRKEARQQPKPTEASDTLLPLVTSRMDINFDSFRLKINRELVSELVAYVEPVMRSRHTLPANWEFVSFTLRDFRQVFTVIQAMSVGWHLARSLAADSGMLDMGYRSAVWVTGRGEMVKRLCRFTTVETDVVKRILDLLTFGSNGVCEPDIATQPLVDLGQGKLALAPFVWMSTSLERNLCTLLNQIPAERNRYSTLTKRKEKAAFAEAAEFLVRLGLVAKAGVVEGTDLDLGIVDHNSKVCLCIEIKWFIEPAEIREIENHTKELAKGIEQAKVLQRLFTNRDKHFLETRLGITPDYRFFCAVGSVNWIGMGDVQDPAVPIVKLWDLLQQIERTTLSEAIEWLRSRRYLPDEGRDFKTRSLDIECGRWTANWYGIEPIEGGTFIPAAA